MNSNVSDSDIYGGQQITEEQKAKVDEMRKLLGPLPERMSLYCSDACIVRYLVARNWNLKKTLKMLKETLQWRLHYKPEEIRWEDIAKEAETGKIFRTSLQDRCGRSVLVMRPGHENSKSVKGQIRYLVYCMENAILNSGQGQSQMVWWIDYDGFNLSDVSFRAARETAHILQEHYPERLGAAILYKPPKFFEPFWKMVKPFLDPKTREKVIFVKTDDPVSTKIVEEILGVDKVDLVFEFDEYAKRMKDDDAKASSFWKSKESNGAAHPVLKISDPKESEDSESNGNKYGDSDAKSSDEETNLESNGVHQSD